MARRLLLLFAALLATLTLAPSQSAADAQNRVGVCLSAAHICAPANSPQSPCTLPGSTAETARIAAGCCVATKAERGGLNLFKWKDATSTTAAGWREGDRMLTVPWKGTAKAAWKENASRLRREMRSGEPIYETYADDAGQLIRAGGPGNSGQFLKAERNLLANHGWAYNPNRRAWLPPTR